MAATTCPTCAATVTAAPPILIVSCSCGTRVRIDRPSATTSGADPLDLYQILGVDPSATDEEIKAAYRRRVRETHPDTGGDADEFHDVQVAWEVLSDPDRRRQHDRHRRSAPRGPVRVPDGVGVSVLVAVRRFASVGLIPRVRLLPCSHDDPLRDLVIGQDPIPGSRTLQGSTVDVVVAGSDASVIWRGLRRDADRVVDQARGVAADAATIAVDAGRRALIMAIRLMFLLFVLALAVVIGVYDAGAGLTVLVIGGSFIAWSAMRGSRRRSRRRVGHRK